MQRGLVLEEHVDLKGLQELEEEGGDVVEEGGDVVEEGGDVVPELGGQLEDVQVDWDTGRNLIRQHERHPNVS